MREARKKLSEFLVSHLHLVAVGFCTVRQTSGAPKKGPPPSYFPLAPAKEKEMERMRNVFLKGPANRPPSSLFPSHPPGRGKEDVNSEKKGSGGKAAKGGRGGGRPPEAKQISPGGIFLRSRGIKRGREKELHLPPPSLPGSRS